MAQWRGERWAWRALLVGNLLAFGVPMAFDQIVGAIGPFEIAEFGALAAVLISLLASRPRVSAPE